MKNIVWLVVGLCSLVGCASDPMAAIPDRLEVQIALSSGQMTLGDTLEITVVAMNPTPHRVEYYSGVGGETCGNLVVEIVDSIGQRVYPGYSVVCNAAAQYQEFAAFERKELKVRLAGTLLREHGLEPGIYNVYGGVTTQFYSRSLPVELKVIAE